MNDPLKHKIFIETDCISEQTMFDYIDKKLNARESHSVEKHLLHCDLCSDAMEGLEITRKRTKIVEINQKVNELIYSSTKNNKLIDFNIKYILSIAASILLLICGVFVFKQFSKKNEIAEFKPEHAVSLPPAPPPARDDGKRIDSINFNSPAGEKEGAAIETKEEFSLNKKAEQKQQNPAFAEAEEPDEKSSVSFDDIASGSVSATKSNVMQTEDNLNGVSSVPSISNFDAPKKDFYQNRNNEILDERKNSDAAGGAPIEEVEQSTESTIATTLTDKLSRAKSDEGGESDKALKKAAKSAKLSRSEAKEKSKAEKESVGAGVSVNLAYAPQSIVAADENTKTLKNIEAAPGEKQEDVEFPDQMPDFPGGKDSLQKFIRTHFVYPANFNIESIGKKKIYVTLIIDVEGNIVTAKILNGINSALDKEALRVINSMPKWIPGKNKGKAVSTSINLPINLE